MSIVRWWSLAVILVGLSSAPVIASDAASSDAELTKESAQKIAATLKNHYYTLFVTLFKGLSSEQLALVTVQKPLGGSLIMYEQVEALFGHIDLPFKQIRQCLGEVKVSQDMLDSFYADFATGLKDNAVDIIASGRGEDHLPISSHIDKLQEIVLAINKWSVIFKLAQAKGYTLSSEERAGVNRYVTSLVSDYIGRLSTFIRLFSLALRSKELLVVQPAGPCVEAVVAKLVPDREKARLIIQTLERLARRVYKEPVGK